MAVVGAGGAGRGVGRMAVPPGGGGQPAARQGNDGHAHLDGTLAALGWSIYALFWGTAGMAGMKHAFELTIARTDGTGNIYLEAAAGVITFMLAGRYFEARAKRRAGAALEALLELGAKEVSVLSNGVEQHIPIDKVSVGDEFVVRPGREDRHGRRRGQRRFRGGCVDAHRGVGAG